MPTRLLEPGMKVDQSIIDRMGRTLIARNSTLDEYIISSMLNLGIMSIYIQDGEYDPADDEKKITPVARKNIERLHTEDPTKVTLSNSIRERVAEGIQYIYNNPESETFAKATASITDDLMDAIENNDAVAIDMTA